MRRRRRRKMKRKMASCVVLGGSLLGELNKVLARLRARVTMSVLVLNEKE